MPRVVIVEGPQGAGKTTITNWLREQMFSTILMRLTGVRDKSQVGELKAYKYHYSLLNAISMTDQCDVDYILDRSFLTEYVYCQLGYKPYTFENKYRTLCEFLDKQIANNYDVIFINLYVGNMMRLADRLHRDKPAYQTFDLQNSIDQQEKYREIIGADMASRCPHVKFYHMDSGQNWRYELSQLLGLNPAQDINNIRDEIRTKMGVINNGQ